MSKFQVGDRVRMTRTVCIDYATFPQGTEGYVVRNDSKGLWVEMPNSENGKLTSWWCLDSNIELVAPADKKREFLERLQSLMREFDTKILISADCNGRPGMGIKIGSKMVVIRADKTENGKYETVWFTADNIMDLDKEWV